MPSKIQPTAKAREKVLEMYGSIDQESVEKFAKGVADGFMLPIRNSKFVKMTWELFFSCLSYQEIWDLVYEEFAIPHEDCPVGDEEFDNI